jgi:hypothetical protein
MMDDSLKKLMREVGDAEIASLNQLFDSRTFSARNVGVILQAHLVAQHALRRYIESLNPELGSLIPVRLTFAQLRKMYLQSKFHLPWLAKGLGALNDVRNSVGHEIEASIPRKMLTPMLDVTRLEDNSEDVPWVCTYFATFASMALAHTSAVARALDESSRRIAVHDEVMRVLDELAPEPSDT